MTYEQFLEKLRNTPRKWELKFDCIRMFEDECRHCPLSKAIGASFSAPVTSSKVLGISSYLAGDIMCAADNYGDKNIRKDLLEACGLEESCQ